MWDEEKEMPKKLRTWFLEHKTFAQSSIIGVNEVFHVLLIDFLD